MHDSLYSYANREHHFTVPAPKSKVDSSPLLESALSVILIKLMPLLPLAMHMAQQKRS